MISSMSAKGDCWDNAPMESFWGTLKNKLVHPQKFKTRLQAKQEITEYIDIFYNRQRKQKNWTTYRQQNLHSDTMQIYSLLNHMDPIFDNTYQSKAKVAIGNCQKNPYTTAT